MILTGPATTGSLVPFTPVDELGCYLDRPSEPANIHLEALLDGHLDPVRLRAAVLQMVAAHPLARARRRRSHGWHRGFTWEITDAPDLVPIDHRHWRTEAELAAHRYSLLASSPPLDLSPPLRIRHAIGPNHDALILNVHHAAMDGLSCVRLLRSIAQCYSGRPDPAGEDPLAVRVPVGRPGSQVGDSTRRRCLRPAARLAMDCVDPGPGCGFHLLSIPFSTVRSGLEKPAATVNDVLIAALVLTVGEWNESHGRSAGTVRVSMPINARATVGADEPLGNLSRLAVIARKQAHRRSADGLLPDITRQTTAAKAAGGQQIDSLSRLFATPWLPVAVKARLLKVSQRLVGSAIADTLLLSNLGSVADPLDFGPGAQATGLWFSPPARMPAGLSVGVITLGGQANLCFRYRRELWDHPAAGRFAVMFRTALVGLGDPRFDEALPDKDHGP
jgi:NRPS condensation-like uncharacterized protein